MGREEGNEAAKVRGALADLAVDEEAAEEESLLREGEGVEVGEGAGEMEWGEEEEEKQQPSI